MPTAIKVENLSKAYQLGEIGTGTISRDLERYWAKIRGKEDPFLRIGEINDRSKKGESDIVWSLKDINFEINQGDAVGIIGRNGAGKSTLLKILSRVTSPTTGNIKVKGRIASLLEVGTGFHPELTGRENIFLNGAILGMRKAEIKKHFDAIVDFAGVQRYIDTPVKRYSSGMYVRLAFAVAAHLESEILIVDEVLAVGDAEFQKKCLGKMGDLSTGQGRTVLFVSHNMGAVKQLCNRGIVLTNGNITLNDDIIKSIENYTYNNINNQISLNFTGPLSTVLNIYSVKINDKTGSNLDFSPNDDLIIDITYSVKEALDDVIIIFSLFNDGIRLLTKRNCDKKIPEIDISYNVQFIIKKHTLRPSRYSLAIGAWANNETLWTWAVDILNFKIEEIWSNDYNKSDEGIINLDISSERTSK